MSHPSLLSVTRTTDTQAADRHTCHRQTHMPHLQTGTLPLPNDTAARSVPLRRWLASMVESDCAGGEGKGDGGGEIINSLSSFKACALEVVCLHPTNAPPRTHRTGVLNGAMLRMCVGRILICVHTTNKDCLRLLLLRLLLSIFACE